MRWRELRDTAARRLGDARDATRLVEEASGLDAAALVLALDSDASVVAVRRFEAMLERRAAGEPLQYVLGRWGFRRLDLFVDRRVLIPRPETEFVTAVALAELDRIGGRLAVDLGTGSGAIALSLALERPAVEVLATDVSQDALAVASANLAGIGGAGARVRLLHGSWYDALPASAVGAVDLVVSNPPYVAESDELPDDVRAWEPADALVAGPTGLEAISVIVEGAFGWLRPGGALVVELAPHQADRAIALATAAGFVDARVEPDLTGRPRVLVCGSRGSSGDPHTRSGLDADRRRV